MKTFKFHQLKIYKTILLLGIAITCLSIVNFEMLPEEISPILNTGLKLLAYGLIAFHFTKTLWYKYYVSYNRKAITIRLNRNILEERTFQFKHLENVVLKENEIHFDYRNQTEMIVLNGFNTNDINKIVQLLKQDL